MTEKERGETEEHKTEKEKNHETYRNTARRWMDRMKSMKGQKQAERESE